MTLAQIKTMFIEILSSWFSNKKVLDKLSEDDNGCVTYDDKPIADITKLNQINKYQKYLNTDLDCFYGEINEYKTLNYTSNDTPILKYNEKVNHNIIYNSDTGYITLKANKIYNIFLTLRGSTPSSTYGVQIAYGIYDANTNILLGVHGIKNTPNHSNYFTDKEYNLTIQLEKDTDIYVKIYSLQFSPSNSSLTSIQSTLSIQEIGRQITIDPVEHINTSQGIEDTPVGHIISHMGNNAPKHYLICDGTEYNIADYPYLAQHFKNEFGSYNYFGGDGTTTFAVPNFLQWWTPAMTSNNSNGYIASCSSQWDSNYSAYKAFNGTINSTSDAWHIGHGASGYQWVQIDFQSLKMIYGIRLYPRLNYASTTSANLLLQGSNDGVNFIDIQTFNFDIWTEKTSQDKILNKPVIYKIYRFASNTHIGDIYFLVNKENNILKCIKYEPTYFMNIKNTDATNYSLEEQVIGTWIDGKPLYRKIINNLSFTSEPFKWIDSPVSIENIEKVVKCGIGQSDTCFMYTFLAKSNSNTIQVWNCAANTNYTYHIMEVEYTKTTD